MGFVRFVGPLALLLAVTPAVAGASTINLNDALANVSFEASVGSTCPTSWTCNPTGFVGTVAPTAAQYPAPNGLASGFVPSGSAAAFAPVTGSSTVILSQTLVGQSWTGGNTYTLDFWMGNPLGGTFLGSAGSMNIYLMVNGTAVSSLCDSGGRNASLQVIGGGTFADSSGACQYNLPSTPLGTYLPTDGKWLGYRLSFVVPVGSTVAGDLGVGFGFVFSGVGAAAENGSLAHLDLAAGATPGNTIVATPEPASLGLLAVGLLALGNRLRKRQ